MKILTGKCVGYEYVVTGITEMGIQTRQLFWRSLIGRLRAWMARWDTKFRGRYGK